MGTARLWLERWEINASSREAARDRVPRQPADSSVIGAAREPLLRGPGYEVILAAFHCALPHYDYPMDMTNGECPFHYTPYVFDKGNPHQTARKGYQEQKIQQRHRTCTRIRKPRVYASPTQCSCDDGRKPDVVKLSHDVVSLLSPRFSCCNADKHDLPTTDQL